MSFGKNKYAAWDGNDPIDQDSDYGELVKRLAGRLDEFESLVIIEYASPSMKVVAKVVLK